MSKTATPASKPGTSGAGPRKDKFVEFYFAHGENATQAAIAAGYSPRTARVQGSKLLTDPSIAAAVAKRRASLQQKAELSAERVLMHVRAMTEFDPGKMFNAKGQLLPVKDMPDDVRLYLEGIDIDEISKLTGKGKNKKLLSILTAKVKLPKKQAALELAMRHLGLFAKDKAGYNPDDDSEPPAAVGVTIDFKDARRRKPS